MAIEHLPLQSQVWTSPRGVPVTFRGRQSLIDPYHQESMVGAELRDALRNIVGHEDKVPSTMSPTDFARLQQYRRNLKDFRRQRLAALPQEWWLKLTGRAPEARKIQREALGKFYTQNPLMWSQGEQRVYKNPKAMEAVRQKLNPRQFQQARYLGQSGYLNRALALRQPIQKTKPRPAPGAKAPEKSPIKKASWDATKKKFREHLADSR